MANGHGGKRPGAGRRPGAKSKTTETAGGKPINELAAEHSPEALRTLAAIMKNTELPAAARVSAANSILDRAHGKPVQGTYEVQLNERPAPFDGWAVEAL